MIGFTKTALATHQTPGLPVSQPLCHSEYPPSDVPVLLPTRRLHLHPPPVPTSRAESGRVRHALDSEVVRASLSVVPSFLSYCSPLLYALGSVKSVALPGGCPKTIWLSCCNRLHCSEESTLCHRDFLAVFLFTTLASNMPWASWQRGAQW